jgi:endoglucanase
VWTPYANSGGHRPFSRYFPGGRWVDWVGLDGINWGGAFPWRSFNQIIGASYRELVRLTSKPIVLAETGSGEQGGNKARWVSAMLRRNIPRMSHIRAIAFWDVDDRRGDLRVDSSAASLRALRSALAKPRYRSSRKALIRVPSLLRAVMARPFPGAGAALAWR